MDLQLKGKVALIAGGSRGIGKAIAIQLAQEGADIVLAARTKDRLDAAAAEIAGKTGRKVIGIVVNTGDDASVKARGAAEAHGRQQLHQAHIVTAEEVAQVVTFLCSPLSIAINGDTIAAGGGVPRAISY